jgi:hypothetical protein
MKKVIQTLIIVLLLGCNVFSQGKKRSTPWNLQYTFASIYDNNILKYSDKYLGRFDAGLDNGRFSVNSSADVVLTNHFLLKKTLYLIDGRKSIPSVEIKVKSYPQNSVKDFWSFRLGWRQYVGKSTSFKVTVGYMPKFYVRNYRDEDWTRKVGYTPESFRAFEFSKGEVSAWFRNYFFKKTQTTFYFSYFWYSHSPDFIEYNSNNFLTGLRVKQTLSKKIAVHGGYNFVTSSARGYDSIGEDITNSDDVNASFVDHALYAGVEIKMPKIFFPQSKLTLTGYYHYRIFTTTKSPDIDPLHSGRTDNVFNVIGMYKVRPLKFFEVAGYLAWNFRNSGSAYFQNEEPISIEKNYNQFLLGLRFRFNILF